MISLLCVTTSASVHDSQVAQMVEPFRMAIPMLKSLAPCVTSLYDLMDSAYDAPGIRQVSAALGHVALIDQNPRRGEKVKFSPARLFATVNVAIAKWVPHLRVRKEGIAV